MISINYIAPKLQKYTIFYTINVILYVLNMYNNCSKGTT